jgi:hypothetical protein
MEAFRFFSLRPAVFALAIWATAQVAYAANYPLEVTNIKPAGTGGINAQNRIYKAYPGIMYNIRAAVIGGAYPYVYSLTAAPSGMTINAQTGEISWPNPQTSGTATLRVQDTEGTVITSSWTINVTTTGFKFVDAINGRNSASNGCSSSCGTGTEANPWRSVRDVIYSTTAAGDFLYFKNGTYRVTDIPRGDAGGMWERIDIEEPKPVVWIAYPGQSPVIDFAYQPGVENGPMLRFTGNNVYVDGFETRNSHIMAFQFVSLGNGATFRKLRMHDHGPGVNGSNASMIMTVRGSANGTVIQDNQFYNSPADVTIKKYGTRKLLVEGNVFHDALNGIELKDSVQQFTVRGNTFYNIPGMAIGGNMAVDDSPTNGEICFNNVRAQSIALDMNQQGTATAIYVYRNTFVGRVQIRWADSQDGPFRLSNNVIVNSDAGYPSGSHVTHIDTIDGSRIVLVNNLGRYPADNAIDAAGNLTSGYASYVGTHGHMISGTTSTTISPPQNVRIVSQ